MTKKICILFYKKRTLNNMIIYIDDKYLYSSVVCGKYKNYDVDNEKVKELKDYVGNDEYSYSNLKTKHDDNERWKHLGRLIFREIKKQIKDLDCVNSVDGTYLMI